jgi:hypothetical protein
MRKRKKLKYSVISLINGIVKIRKPCGYCGKKHASQFPVDDLLVKRRMCSLCDICFQQLEQVRKKHPGLFRRGGESEI